MIRSPSLHAYYYIYINQYTHIGIIEHLNGDSKRVAILLTSEVPSSVEEAKAEPSER